MSGLDHGEYRQMGMDVYVNRMYEDQAKHLIQEAFSRKEDLSDQELEELAMGTHSDEV